MINRRPTLGFNGSRIATGGLPVCRDGKDAYRLRHAASGGAMLAAFPTFSIRTPPPNIAPPPDPHYCLRANRGSSGGNAGLTITVPVLAWRG